MFDNYGRKLFNVTHQLKLPSAFHAYKKFMLFGGDQHSCFVGSSCMASFVVDAIFDRQCSDSTQDRFRRVVFVEVTVNDAAQAAAPGV